MLPYTASTLNQHLVPRNSGPPPSRSNFAIWGTAKKIFGAPSPPPQTLDEVSATGDFPLETYRLTWSLVLIILRHKTGPMYLIANCLYVLNYLIFNRHSPPYTCMRTLTTTATRSCRTRKRVFYSPGVAPQHTRAAMSYGPPLLLLCNRVIGNTAFCWLNTAICLLKIINLDLTWKSDMVRLWRMLTRIGNHRQYVDRYGGAWPCHEDICYCNECLFCICVSYFLSSLHSLLLMFALFLNWWKLLQYNNISEGRFSYARMWVVAETWRLNYYLSNFARHRRSVYGLDHPTPKIWRGTKLGIIGFWPERTQYFLDCNLRCSFTEIDWKLQTSDHCSAQC